MKQPILFILFNRLDKAQQVFSAIKSYQPYRLYISADGPRDNKQGEEFLTDQVRDWVLKQVNWDCEVKTLFQEKNLGCGRAPYTAISWFFENEEEGIVLEDDCVPNIDFFKFCEIMLDYYRDNDRISIISGCNFDTAKTYSTAHSYFFSVFPYTWGWATWRKNWKEYDYTIAEWNKVNKKKFANHIFNEKRYNQSWIKLFDKLSKNVPDDIWDYQFFFQCFKRKQLSVVPNVNLITNIGSGEMATHTVNDNNPKINLKTELMMFPLTHPSEINRNFQYDVFLQELNYGVIEKVPVLKKIKRLVKKQMRLIKH